MSVVTFLGFLLKPTPGFRGAWEKGHIFTGDWVTLAIIFRKLGVGGQDFNFGELGSTVRM